MEASSSAKKLAKLEKEAAEAEAERAQCEEKIAEFEKQRNAMDADALKVRCCVLLPLCLVTCGSPVCAAALPAGLIGLLSHSHLNSDLESIEIEQVIEAFKAAEAALTAITDELKRLSGEHETLKKIVEKIRRSRSVPLSNSVVWALVDACLSVRAHACVVSCHWAVS